MGNAGPGVGTEAGGNIVETIVALLKQAGAQDVEAVSLRTPQLPRQAEKDADVMFPKLVKAALDADPPSKISGRIVDAHGQPIAGASVRATLQLTMLSVTSPGANYLVPYRSSDERFSAATRTDGRFELSDLCKGTYMVRAEAPGLAWKERKTFLAPDLESASVEFVMDQPDAISGQVRDPQGKPIANATVTPTERQHFVGDELQYIASPAGDAVRTDDAGRFRLARLQEGRYIIEVKARGHKDRELEPIPAGTENVAVTLERQ
jgi:hypothetical protein